MARMEAFFEQQQQFNERLEQRVTEHLTNERENSTTRARMKKRLPKELSGSVREVYASLRKEGGECLEWDFSKCLNDPDNRSVNLEIIAGVRSTDSSTPTALIKAAIRAHFETKKRQKKTSDSNRQGKVREEQRRRSRKNTKRLKRVKALSESTTISPEEKQRYLPCMTADFMSSEESVSEEEEMEGYSSESDAESASQRKHLCVKPLPWRSRELNDLMARLDRKIARRRSQKSAGMVLERKQGPPSARQAPDDVPDFAIMAS
ncbi:uncharacterized protein [Montipora capricornis]|uniref:uncharacterized protein n=1 Tax=Montipora capricornis TaxID=246305 RepID=UPI0035F18A47